MARKRRVRISANNTLTPRRRRAQRRASKKYVAKIKRYQLVLNPEKPNDNLTIKGVTMLREQGQALSPLVRVLLRTYFEQVHGFEYTENGDEIPEREGEE